MKEERRKRLSIAEKRALSGSSPDGQNDPLILGQSLRGFDPPDLNDIEPEWMPVVQEVVPQKIPISLRVDPDVLAFFKEQGPGYQTRMNAVLRGYMQAKKAVRRG